MARRIAAGEPLREAGDVTVRAGIGVPRPAAALVDWLSAVTMRHLPKDKHP